MITTVTNAYRKAWATAVTLYKTAAFVALVAWIAVAVSAQHSGYAQVTLPLGNTVQTADGTEMAKEAASFVKKNHIQQQAAADPLPVPKPPVPVKQ